MVGAEEAEVNDTMRVHWPNFVQYHQSLDSELPTRLTHGARVLNYRLLCNTTHSAVLNSVEVR